MSSAKTRPSYNSHRSSYSKPSTTPHGLPGRAPPPSVGQPLPPLLTPTGKTTPAAQDPRTPSPNYFGFVVETSNPPDSNPGEHARRNWEFPGSQGRTTTLATPRVMALDANPEFEAFRRQSESNRTFSLSHGSLSSFSGPQKNDISLRISPTSAHKRPIDSPVSPTNRRASPPNIRKEDGMEVDSDDSTAKSFFDIPRNDSPSSISSGLTIPEVPFHRHSIPHNNPSSSTSSVDEMFKIAKPHRAGTMPPSGVGAPTMISSDELAELIQNDDVLMLDLRVFPQFSASCIRGALNLCIPTTLLKRPSFTIQKLMDTFTNKPEKERFAKWHKYQNIVVYDANSNALKEAVAPVHVLKKFVNEGWTGHALILKGGFLNFSRKHPELVEASKGTKSGSGAQTLSLAPAGPEVAPVAGGCPMPTSQNAANPFFANIRQNMDLIGGVGQMSINHPNNMTSQSEKALPTWLRTAAETQNNGKEVSDKFLHIEQTEQKRMQEALSVHVTYGTSGPEPQKPIQIAGIEKGSKNRYNNIFPYDHTRVKLQDVPDGGCDYINANFVKTAYSNKNYVATQAPIPATFADFWRLVWEQDVRVIVMLTAEAEGGQVKSHPYWHSGDYGPLKLKSLSEKKIALDESPKPTPPLNANLRRPALGQRRSTNPHTAAEMTQATEEARGPSEAPFITVRHLTLSHSAFPFQPMREITQIQYTSWPDFGAPAHPKDLLNLIKHADRYVRKSLKPGQAVNPDQPIPENQRPVVVHCSAGCGRTGTFCTVDSVIDMLKRQRLSCNDHHKESSSSHGSEMEIDSDDWIHNDDLDLVAKAVEDFRSQRLSMVQSLRQFVLCYESVLEWVVNENEKANGFATKLKDRKGLLGHGPRRSFGG